MANFNMVNNLQPLIQKYAHQRLDRWNILGILYIVFTYLSGILLFFSSDLLVNFFGVILLTHSLILSAYMTHEFIHNTVFKNKTANQIFSNLMLWINGSCYFGFSELQKLHIAHHRDKVDISPFNSAEFLDRTPFKPVILALEWFHFPSIALWLRGRQIFLPFFREDLQQARVSVFTFLAIRVTLFSILAYFSIKALFLYFISFIGMVIVLQFMDAFQHTYEVISTEQSPETIATIVRSRDSIYEQENTFSTLLSRRFWLLNLLLLNFGYHNAHHAIMNCPWYNLRRLDEELYPRESAYHFTFFPLLKNYHRFRIRRLFEGQGKAIESDRQTLEQFYGAIGVSFLVPVGKLANWQEVGEGRRQEAGGRFLERG
ncbi:fatty acid desaturase [Pannus brasiliensis CCIBt3594]|uniref:Fatty acid desaturase n=1 Tax=Pannus brasiliensis CCIBt3594 TaxID=1427578 RepID=A0AAW9QJ70_9CHRO